MTNQEEIEYLNNHYLVEGSPVNPSIEKCKKHNTVMDMAIEALKNQIEKYVENRTQDRTSIKNRRIK